MELWRSLRDWPENKGGRFDWGIPEAHCCRGDDRNQTSGVHRDARHLFIIYFQCRTVIWTWRSTYSLFQELSKAQHASYQQTDFNQLPWKCQTPYECEHLQDFLQIWHFPCLGRCCFISFNNYRNNNRFDFLIQQENDLFIKIINPLSWKIKIMIFIVLASKFNQLPLNLHS